MKLKPDIEHPALEALLLAEPNNEMHWQVYADWLSEQGDPRGRLLAIKLAGGKAARRVFKDEKPVRESLLHQLGVLEGIQVVVELGFVKRLKLLAAWGRLEGRYQAQVARKVEAMAALLESNYLRFCEEMSLDTVRGLDYAALFSCWKRPLLRLKRLTVGTVYAHDMRPGEIGRFAELAPCLEVFNLAVHGQEQCSWGSGSHWPCLKSLSIEVVRCDAGFFTGLQEGFFPALQELRVHPLDPSHWDDVKNMLWKANFPSLTHFALTNVEHGPLLLEDLMRSPILPRLKYLGLSYNSLGAAGGELLIANRARFQHLRLRLEENDFTPEQEERLLNWPNVVSEEWGPPEL